jgi:hypothetical protein
MVRAFDSGLVDGDGSLKNGTGMSGVTGQKAATTTDTAIVEAFERGYTVTDEGKVISPSGRERALATKSHRQGSYQSFTYVLGSRPNRKTVNIPLHRFIGYIVYGMDALQPGIKVYHANNDVADNRVSNIRIGTPSDVMMARNTEDRKRIAGTTHRRGGPRKVQE